MSLALLLTQDDGLGMALCLPILAAIGYWLLYRRNVRPGTEEMTTELLKSRAAE